MDKERAQRRLAAILAADVVGYSRLMEADDAGTLAALKARRKTVLEPLLAKHHGRIFKIAGDGVLVEFASAVNAVQCAIDLQHGMAAANAAQPEDRQIVLRVGINLGDIMVEGSDLYGDGVNIAARLEALAHPGGILISGAAHDHVAGKVNAQFDDLGAQFLKNITRPVRAYRIASLPETSIGAEQARDESPTIAVLPFANMSGDSSQDYFSDGITEDLITELSRFRDLAVVARNSSFAYRGKSAAVQQVSRELGADFVLEGSVRRIGERVRITAQLVDAKTGKHLWAERYDRGMQDLFAIHDEIIATIVSSLSKQIDSAIVFRAQLKPPANWKAYDHLLSAIATVAASRFSRSAYERALEHLAAAIKIDPQYSRAFGWRAALYQRMALFFCKGDVEELSRLLRLSREDARRAVSLDEGNADGIRLLGWSQIWTGGFPEAEHLFERAYSLNPNDSYVAMSYATALIYLGRPDQAVALAEATIQRTKPYPEWFLSDLAEAYFYARRYDDAAALFEKLPEDELDENRAAVICSFAFAGKHDKAGMHAERYLAKLRADWIGDSTAGVAEILDWEFLHFLPFRRPDDVANVREGLRLAGLPA